MKKFHISSDGVARECRADKGKCRLKQSDSQHYPTREAAQEAANKQNEQQYGKMSKLSKSQNLNGFKKIEEKNININYVNSITSESFISGNINTSSVDIIDEKPSADFIKNIYSGNNLYSTF